MILEKKHWFKLHIKKEPKYKQRNEILRNEFLNQIEKKAFEQKKKRDIAIVAIDLAKELSAIQAAAAANPANALTLGAAGISQAAILSAFAIGRSAIQAGIIGSQKYLHYLLMVILLRIH